uniref:Uncharacterized protein MANES_05G010400 n=1 Tax=Rhizophora mucronata TaxID=61149 RepID=A0A2P2JAW7_RHIMU
MNWHHSVNLDVHVTAQVCFFLHVQLYDLQGSLEDEIVDFDQ